MTKAEFDHSLYPGALERRALRKPGKYDYKKGVRGNGWKL
jgi:hypothetical protein